MRYKVMKTMREPLLIILFAFHIFVFFASAFATHVVGTRASYRVDEVGSVVDCKMVVT